MKNPIKLLISFFICQLAGIIGSIFTASSVKSWYRTLNKPLFTPPSCLITFVWTILFVLMGLSLFFIWKKFPEDKRTKKGLFIFILQLVFNILWSALFFGLKSSLLGFVDIIILWVLILITILNFFRISKLAGLLLIPYILWVSFAGILNFAIWILNK